MRTEDFDYHLPPHLIAQTPVPRGESRLLILHKETGQLELRQFSDLFDYLQPGDTLVVNDSRVTARRLMGRRESGAEAEALLLRPEGEECWSALVRPGKSLRPGARITFSLRDGRVTSATVVGVTEEGGRILEFESTDIRDAMLTEGVTPLPPYITEGLPDESRYQTVYAGPGGSAAAPTAGLHFTEEMLERAQSLGIGLARVTLHVGIDTFRPVKVDNLEEHVMHGEWYTVSDEAAQTINSTKGRIIAIGTTTVRVLESAAAGPREIKASSGDTRLFITPGYQFKLVDVLLTNFHLPKSTLLMLASALAGSDNIKNAYRAAVDAEFRFYSFGDAMLIV
jgi:S-adenosylmethionine:tRNA ribosyltransferase-isomerase